jgi:acyl carrier protein
MLDNVKVEIISAIASITDQPAELYDEQTSLADLGVDSLQALQLLVLLEREYKISLNDEDLKRFKNVASIVGLVTERVQLIPESVHA